MKELVKTASEQSRVAVIKGPLKLIYRDSILVLRLYREVVRALKSDSHTAFPQVIQMCSCKPPREPQNLLLVSFSFRYPPNLKLNKLFLPRETFSAILFYNANLTNTQVCPKLNETASKSFHFSLLGAHKYQIIRTAVLHE